MFEYHKKHGEFEIFAEKRLVFQTNPEKVPKSAKELADNSAKLLADLHAAVEGNKKQRRKKRPKSSHEERPPTTVHTGREDTREMYRPPEKYEKSVDIAMEAVRLKGKMNPFETQLMQTVHGNLHEQYLNPAFMHYLQQIGKADKVYPVLDLVMKTPDNFRYQSMSDNKVEIRKRKPTTDADKKFLIVMKTAKGFISHVNDGVNDVSLETGGGIDWMTNEAYNKQMENYRARFQSEYEQKGKWDEYRNVDLNWPLGPARTQKMIEMAIAPYLKISKEMQKIYELENIQFPKRLIAMIEARGLAFEKDHRFYALKDRMQKQGKNYVELTQNRYSTPSSLQVIVIKHPEVKGAYRILMRPKNYTEGDTREDEVINITKEGYYLVQDANGKWSVDPRYEDFVKRNYYKKNPDALTPKDRKNMTEEEKRIEDARAKAEKAKENRLKRYKVKDAIRKAELEDLKRAGKAVAPAKFHPNIDEMTDEKDVRERLRRTLDEPENVIKIAKALKVNLDQTK